jgi:hypothetical protein
MAKVLPRVILLRGRGRRREAPAAAAMTPGHLLSYDSSGTFVKHAVAGGPWQGIVCVEDDHNGNGIDTAYASGDYVQAEQVGNGCDVNLLVPAAAAAIARNGPVKSNGDGTVIAQGGTGTIIGWALEAVDNSAGGAAARIKVMLAAPGTA